jgi:hypothetical protein
MKISFRDRYSAIPKEVIDKYITKTETETPGGIKDPKTAQALYDFLVKKLAFNIKFTDYTTEEGDLEENWGKLNRVDLSLKKICTIVTDMGIELKIKTEELATGKYMFVMDEYSTITIKQFGKDEKPEKPKPAPVAPPKKPTANWEGRYENTTPGHSKFWTIEENENGLYTATWGKIGNRPAMKDDYTWSQATKLVREKLGKGYIQV